MSSETIRKWKPSADEDVVRYKINVSAKYLDLTKRKVELTRLPRQIELPESQSWKLGTPKSAIEPLLDVWLDTYSWREQEELINDTLPQYRLTLSLPIVESKDTDAEGSLRVHYVHKRSPSDNAIPLLYVHGYPGSFLEVFKILDPLTSTIPTHLDDAATSFHVVAPSIPGFGFSDASTECEYGARSTAKWWDALMRRLGYQRYVVACSIQGWAIARWFKVEQSGCIAVHTCLNGDEKVVEERPRTAVQDKRPAWSVFKKSKEDVRPKVVHTESQVVKQVVRSGMTPHQMPQTVAYGLCDSPVGLLAATLNQLFDMGNLHLWSQTDVLNWTMLQWLPGPEAALRWSWTTDQEDFSLPPALENVVLGVTIYHRRSHNTADDVGSSTPPAVAEHPTALQEHSIKLPITWSRTRRGEAGMPAFDSPSDIIIDLRNFCATGRRDGWLDLSAPRGEVASATQMQDFAETSSIAQGGIDAEEVKSATQESLGHADEVSRESHWRILWRWIATNLKLRRIRHNGR